MQEVISSEITKFNSENVQNFMFPSLPKRVEILEREEFLFLPTDWHSNEELVVLNFIAKLRGYKVDYANLAPKHSTAVVFNEIERAIKQVTNLELKDYAVKDRSLNLFHARVIYSKIAIDHSIDKKLIQQKINKKVKEIQVYIVRHEDLFRFDLEYRKIYNDVMQEITDNKII